MDEVFFFTVFGAAVASALLFAAAYLRARRRLSLLEDRLLGAGPGDGELESRVNELALRVAHLARGQEFLQQLLSGRRRLPQAGKSYEATPS
jgi:hypothetical protein